MTIILATSSPRRKDLFSELKLPFKMHPSHIDENLDPQHYTPETFAIELAIMKAQAIQATLPSHSQDLIIGADTIVSIQGQILGKPEDINDAKRMLNLLSNQWHDVITGVAFVPVDRNLAPITAHEKTSIKMKRLSQDDINTYVESGEPLDKAGSYAIQGEAAKFIEETKGCYTNVVGFPMPLIKQILKDTFNLL